MSSLNLTHTLVAGANEDINDVQDNFQDIVDWSAGNIGTDNLAPAAGITADQLADAAKLGLSGASTVRRGKTIIATEQSVTSTSYAFMGTIDTVINVVLPTDGLIFVAYQALWKSSVQGAGHATIFVGSSQLSARESSNVGVAAPRPQEIRTTADANEYEGLSTASAGLWTSGGTGGINATSDVTTGQVVGVGISGSFGGPCCIFAAAGTYNVSVAFKSATGSVTAKERKLWVWTMGF